MSGCEFDVVAAGHLCLDMIPRFETDIATGRIADVLRPGALVNMGGMTFSTGGSVSNVGIAMKIFGCRVAFVAKVGDDPLGRIIIDFMRRSGSAEGIKISAEAASSYTVILALPGIDRIFLHCPGANDAFGSSDLNLEVVGRSRLFHFGYPTLMRSMFADGGEELARILQAAKAEGVTTSLDTSLPDPGSPAGRADWPGIYRKVLPHTDIFLPSIEEILFTLHPEEYLRRKSEAGGQELIDRLQPEEYTRLAGEMLALGCRVAAIKAGHRGWYVKTADPRRLEGMGRAAPRNPEAWAERELWCPAFQVDRIASATGSGDSSIAGFLTALLRGHPLERCLRLANGAGALNLRALDSLSGLVGWEELEAAVEEMPVRDNAFLQEPWRWNPELKLWEKRRST